MFRCCLQESSNTLVGDLAWKQRTVGVFHVGTKSYASLTGTDVTRKSLNTCQFGSVDSPLDLFTRQLLTKFVTVSSLSTAYHQ